MSDRPTLLDELRTEYEAARQVSPAHADVEGFQQIDARMRKAFRWLEKAIAYLDGLKPAINHRFDLGHGMVFEAPRFQRGFVGQHERRIVGFPVLDEINIYYVVSAAKPLAIDIRSGSVGEAESALSDAGLQYTKHSTEDSTGAVCKCLISVPPEIPASISFHVDYQTGVVKATLANVDRLERVTLEFHSNAIDEPILEDLVRLILGRDSAFLRRAPLAGVRGTPA